MKPGGYIPVDELPERLINDLNRYGAKDAKVRKEYSTNPSRTLAPLAQLLLSSPLR